MITPKVEKVGLVVKGTMQRQLGDKGTVRPVVTVERCHLPKNRHPDYAIHVVAAVGV